MATVDRSALPTYSQLIYPTLKAIHELGGSGKLREIVAQVVADIEATDEQLSVTYDDGSKAVLPDRITWAVTYAKHGKALESPSRALYLLTPLGRSILGMAPQEAEKRIKELDRQVRRSRSKRPGISPEGTEPTSFDPPSPAEDQNDEQNTEWKEVLLKRLHRLSPDGFEEFVIFLLKSFDMELTRVGGSGDEGIDGIGLAPISAVLSSRVAVQAKRHDPGSSLGRDVVALFQRDAYAAGAERAVLVTLGRFTAAAKDAAIKQMPTVNLIDGDRICELVQEKELGIRSVPTVIPNWFDKFEKP